MQRHSPKWRKRGTGLPPKYGPAHTADPLRPSMMGNYAYCGTWFPVGRDHLWANADPDDRKCRECERGDRLARERTAAITVHPDHPRGNT